MLERMKFKYKKYGPKFIRPVISIRVSNKDGSKSRRYEVLIDSGADLNIFDAEIAELLGIDLESGQESFVYGITSSEPEPFISTKFGWTLAAINLNLTRDLKMV